jgi:hypothetical protein
MYLFVTEEPQSLCGQSFDRACPPVGLTSHLFWEISLKLSENPTLVKIFLPII